MLPLNLKLNDADTSFPLLVEGKYPLVISKAELGNSKTGKGSFLVVVYKTTEDAQGSKGQSIGAGFPLTTRYMLPIPGTEFGDGEHVELHKANLCRFMLAVANLTDTPANKENLPEFTEEYITSLPGVMVIGIVKTAKPQPGQEEYGEKSEVKAVSAVG